MANESIDNALVIQFSDQVHVAAQQSKARLRPLAVIKQMKGDYFAYDGLGLAEAAEIIGRHQPVVFSDIEHKRRKISRRRYALVLPVDASDVRGALINPQSEYAMACARAMERVFDRVVYEAMFATVYTGRDMDTAVSFSSDGGDTVNATAGLTYEKLLELRQSFMDDEVGNEMPVVIGMGISGDEHTALMKETELISGDYTRQYVVEGGEIQKAAGFNLIKFAGAITRPILTVSGGTRNCFAVAQGGMCVGMSKEMEISIDKRADLHETTQVAIVFELGAVRTEGVLVKKVTTTD
jgi:hypothetical protein